MTKNIEHEIEQIIIREMAALNRSDLFRTPLVAFSSAHDKRYAELKEIVGEWHLRPDELLPEAKSVISYFVPFTKTVVSEPKNTEDAPPIWGEAYDIINSYFNHINETLSEYLSGLGFSSQSIPATHTYDPKELKSMWSHRSAAAIAGLGTFGANRLLITEKGSGGRFGALLTSAPLKVEQKPASVKCLYVKNGSCDLCHKICPVGALSHNGIERFVCHDELSKNGKILRARGNFEKADACGKCISVCPVAYIE